MLHNTSTSVLSKHTSFFNSYFPISTFFSFSLMYSYSAVCQECNFDFCYPPPKIHLLYLLLSLCIDDAYFFCMMGCLAFSTLMFSSWPAGVVTFVWGIYLSSWKYLQQNSKWQKESSVLLTSSLNFTLQTITIIMIIIQTEQQCIQKEPNHSAVYFLLFYIYSTTTKLGF